MAHADEEMINRVPEKRSVESGTSKPAQRPRVTFRGNSYDLTALGALASGVLVLLMCLTFGQFAYCLPFIALVLGAIGLLAGKDAINPERTRLWSWLGIGGAGLSVLLTILLFFSYLACFFFMMMLSYRRW
jgi:hypothetical protein